MSFPRADWQLLATFPPSVLYRSASLAAAFAKYSRARLTGLANDAGLLELARSQGEFTFDEIADASSKIGFAPSSFRREMLRTWIDLLALTGSLTAASADTYRVTARPASIPVPRIPARHAPTFAWYDACWDRSVDVLRGGPREFDFGPRWVEVWDGILGADEQLFRRRLALRAMGFRGSRGSILDLCYGTGSTLEAIFREAPEADVKALDAFDSGQGRARERIALALRGRSNEPRIRFIPADSWREGDRFGFEAPLPIPDASLDAVFFPMNEGFLTPGARASLYREFHRVLKPSGTVGVVSACHPERDAPDVELSAHILAHEFSEFSVDGFLGLPRRNTLVDGALRSGLELAHSPKGILGGLVWVFRKPA